MFIAVNNITKKPETQFRERVKEVMIKQILKKIYGTGGKDNELTKVASLSCTKSNNIQK